MVLFFCSRSVTCYLCVACGFDATEAAIVSKTLPTEPLFTRRFFSCVAADGVASPRPVVQATPRNRFDLLCLLCFLFLSTFAFLFPLAFCVSVSVCLSVCSKSNLMNFSLRHFRRSGIFVAMKRRGSDVMASDDAMQAASNTPLAPLPASVTQAISALSETDQDRDKDRDGGKIDKDKGPSAQGGVGGGAETLNLASPRGQGGSSAVSARRRSGRGLSPLARARSILGSFCFVLAFVRLNFIIWLGVGCLSLSPDTVLPCRVAQVQELFSS